MGLQFPLYVGEFGSGLDLYSTVPAYLNQQDVDFISNFAVYINEATAYLHVAISNFNWWCWNANTVRCCSPCCILRVHSCGAAAALEAGMCWQALAI